MAEQPANKAAPPRSNARVIGLVSRQRGRHVCLRFCNGAFV